MRQHTNNFHLLRLAAAFQVALFHVADHFGLHGGVTHALALFPGVPIFFVISGFLVSESLERSTLPQYALNRTLRIYPALWVCLAVSIAFAAASGVDFSHSLRWLLAQVTFLQFYNPDFLRGFGVGVLNGNLWTIPVELQFYVALPLLAAVLVTRRALVLAIVGCAVVNVAIAMSFDHSSLAGKAIAVTLAPHLYMFLAGVLLQKNRDLINRYLKGRLAAWLTLYLAVTLSLGALGLPVLGNAINPVSALLLAAVVIAAAFARPLPLKHDFSYGLYLYHIPVLNLFVEHRRESLLDGAATIAIAFVLAVASWFAIEKPALKLKYLPAMRRLVTSSAVSPASTP